MLLMVGNDPLRSCVGYRNCGTVLTSRMCSLGHLSLESGKMIDTPVGASTAIGFARGNQSGARDIFSVRDLFLVLQGYVGTTV